MADDSRPSLEPPRLFGRRRPKASPEPDPEPTAVLDPVPDPVPDDTEVAEPAFVDAALQPELEREEPDEPTGPPVTGAPAALVAGVAVGLVLVGLVWLGQRGCDAVRGTSSCGTGPGMLGLVVVLVLAVVAGRYLLATFAAPDPGSTSFLAVALTGVIALLFLVDVLDTWPMVLVVPAVSAATFLLSWWVTSRVAEG